MCARLWTAMSGSHSSALKTCAILCLQKSRCPQVVFEGTRHFMLNHRLARFYQMHEKSKNALPSFLNEQAERFLLIASSERVFL